jgi:hypothetical protein
LETSIKTLTSRLDSLRVEKENKIKNEKGKPQAGSG